MNTQPAILVTGGCGYIGSHTVIALIEQGKYEVISCDNFVNSSPKALERIARITGVQVRNYAIDLCKAQDTEKIFAENPHLIGVIHFAALKSVPESVEQPLRYYYNNLNSLINLLEACRKYRVNHFIFSSSCSVYGNADQLPVTEQTPFKKAESPYASTKQMGEEIVSNIVAAYALKAISLRYFNPVGAHMSGLIGEDALQATINLVPIITQTAAGLRPELVVAGNDYPTRDGTCIRDYIHVSDVAEAHIAALEYLFKQPLHFYDVFNIGTGTGITVLEAIEAFQRATGISLNYRIGQRRPGDVVAVYADTSKTEAVLGWRARFGLMEMMASAWKWQQQLLLEASTLPLQPTGNL
ncbi:MAG: UDP-glucose 4-epimerase GalE [Cytophagales bacterium]|nr:UDP-glucose 4-epimerase GalE [Bernardetiaceae bacterium]MDW8210390.1 UDP-glucose 4-epimerase GalE [Cytophagales bacterium]